jgi:hypothetical protein
MKHEDPVPHAELRSALQSALGEERAESAVRNAAQALGCEGEVYSRSSALAILGHIAEQDGIIGISARFARSRLMTRWATAQLGSLRGGDKA